MERKGCKAVEGTIFEESVTRCCQASGQLKIDFYIFGSLEFRIRLVFHTYDCGFFVTRLI